MIADAGSMFAGRLWYVRNPELADETGSKCASRPRCLGREKGWNRLTTDRYRLSVTDEG